MKIRIITGIALVAIVLPCVLIGGPLFRVLLYIVLTAAGYELVHAIFKRKYYLYLVTCTFLLLSNYFSHDRLFVESYMIMIYLAVILAIVVFDNQVTIDRGVYLFTFSVLISQGIYSLRAIEMNYSVYYLLLLAFATFGCDTFAYFGGVVFGKHKLIPHLSPNKTIEGSIVGIVCGSLLAIIFGYLTNLIPGHEILILGIVILTITAQIGDLVFSSLKRYFKIKDFSNLLPGHGGILDRIDSLVFNAMIFSIVLINVRL